MKKYFYSKGKEKSGPFSFEELKNEGISKDTLIWFEGLDDWKYAREIKEFEEILELTPPPIPSDNLKSKTPENESYQVIEENKQYQSNSSSTKQGMFSISFSFQGRIRRTEYGISFIIFAILFSIINVLIEESVELAFLVFLYIPLYWFFFAQGAKRSHDLGNSGWYQLIPLYPLWLLFGKGEEGISNKYGTNPKL